MQFDHAEFDQAVAPSMACAACGRPIEDRYYEINGAVLCEPCKGAIEAQLAGGSGLAGVFRALVFGTGAGALGALAYVIFMRVTHIDFSLVSIFVGYLIGRGVRAGSRNRGGLIYQLIAVGLTYFAIGVAYTSVFFMQMFPTPRSMDEVFGLAGSFLWISSMIPVFKARRSVITIAIIGFALWKAWQMNVRARLVFTGPYGVGPGETELTEGGPDHA